MDFLVFDNKDRVSEVGVAGDPNREARRGLAPVGGIRGREGCAEGSGLVALVALCGVFHGTTFIPLVPGDCKSGMVPVQGRPGRAPLVQVGKANGGSRTRGARARTVAKTNSEEEGICGDPTKKADPRKDRRGWKGQALRSFVCARTGFVLE